MSNLLEEDQPFYRSRRGAIPPGDGEYRYWLWRTWDRKKPVVAFIMLNPSTADETTLDNTCRRCRNYAEDWGYGTLIVGNIFALRSTDPSNLYDHPDPIGPDNDEHLLRIVDVSDKVIGAWGVHGSHMDRATEVYEMVDTEIYALSLSKEGHPKHPLYQKKDVEPFPWYP